MDPLRAAVASSLRVHPRVAQQGIGASEADRERLAAALPPLVPFGGRRPHLVVALLDWDHRLPSKQLWLRAHVLYGPGATSLFERALEERNEELRARDLFPEFDVPDWEELPSDESYEAELSPALAVQSMRLVSSWRRDVDPEKALRAVERVRASEVFQRVRAGEPTRSPHLGDLEPVAWMPPCESGYARWTIDVWWLTAFDGRIGRGWSFLVDMDAPDPVVTHREFSVRAG